MVMRYLNNGKSDIKGISVLGEFVLGREARRMRRLRLSARRRRLLQRVDAASTLVQVELQIHSLPITTKEVNVRVYKKSGKNKELDNRKCEMEIIVRSSAKTTL